MTKKFNILYKAITEAVVGRITPDDIYTLYFLNGLYLNSPSNYQQQMKRSVEQHILPIVEKYHKNFRQLLIVQLKKYIERGRVDDDLLDYNINNLSKESDETLSNMMLKTYRSDMERRNVRWNSVAQNFQKLNNSRSHNSLIGMMEAINLLNNCIHNTQESILTKFRDGYNLFDALQYSANEKTTLKGLYDKVKDKLPEFEDYVNVL